MQIDTNTLYSMANQLRSCYQSYSFKKSSLQTRHNEIGRRLQSLSTFLDQTANQYEQLENQVNQKVKLPSFSKAHTLWSDSISYTHKNYSASYTNEFGSANACMSLGQVKASGSVKAQFIRNNQFDPSLKINAQASGTLLSANANARIGNEYVYANVNAKGSVGTVYAKANAAIDKTGVDIDAGIGAAAARGEVKCSFNVFGIGITLTGSGSIGSAELSASYRHKNREWEVGSKMGFIAGLGWKVKVTY